MLRDLRKDLKKFVPLREIHFFIAKKEGQEPKGYVTKDALLDKLEALTIENPEILSELKELLIRYKFAGKGSISWSMPESEDTISKEELQSILIEKAGGNLFEKELRPEITSKPALNKAEWLRENLLRLEFVYADKVLLIEENYEIKEIRPTRRAIVFIRLLNDSHIPFVVESRASFNKSRYLHKTVSNILGIRTLIIDFSDEDIERLKTCLNAKKKAARHKKSAGDFDIVEVTAAPTVDDLDDAEQYQSLLSGDELRKARYKFTYTSPDGCSYDVTIYISNKGCVWFMSEVPEEVIDYVFSCIRAIKNF